MQRRIQITRRSGRDRRVAGELQGSAGSEARRTYSERRETPDRRRDRDRRTGTDRRGAEKEGG